MTDLTKLAWRNLWRNRRRTLITLAAVALSVMLVQAFHNLSFGVYREMINAGVRAGSGHLAVYHRNYLPDQDEKLLWPAGDLPQRIAAIPGVVAALPRLYLAGLAQSSRESRGIVLTGVDPELEARFNPFLRHMVRGDPVEGARGHRVIVGEQLLRELKLRPGQKLVITVQSRDGELRSELFRIGGVVRTHLREVDRTLVMAERHVVAGLSADRDAVHTLSILLANPKDDRRIGPRIENLIAGSDLRLVSWDEAMPNLANAIRLDYASQKFIFVIILLIVTIGVVNTQLMAVMERMREFGVLLALGTRPARLRRLILLEGTLLGILAGLTGSILGSLATLYLAEVGIDLRDFLPETLEFGGVVFDPVLKAGWDVPYMAGIVLFVALLALLAGLYPARKAGRIQPVAAMRAR